MRILEERCAVCGWEADASVRSDATTRPEVALQQHEMRAHAKPANAAASQPAASPWQPPTESKTEVALWWYIDHLRQEIRALRLPSAS